jgi:thymidylate synthase ThyX
VTHDITLIDDLDPETLAMLQALYSRSPASVHDHLAKVKEAGAGEFMGRYFVGYGHASIGDCGVTALFIEGVTMLTAKAIQDWPLYSGQEASTRYMDFSNAVFANPMNTAEGEAIQERWRAFYLRARDPVLAHLRAKYPRQEDEDEKTYKRAINARSFDILRAFLPAGASTNLSWTTNLRQANDKLRWLLHHPSRRIRDLTCDMLDELRGKYEHSFGQGSLKVAREGGTDQDVDNWTAGVMQQHYMLKPTGGRYAIETNIRFADLRPYARVLAQRPRGAELPHWMGELGTIRSEFPLDFGSYRDIQRHRNGTIRMPLLTTSMGFHLWYLDQLPDELREEAVQLIEEQDDAIHKLGAGDVAAQDYIAMGFCVPVHCTQTLPAFVYRLEIRASKTVHPTLRNEVLREVAWFRHHFPDIALHVDTDPDSWTVRRGKQTIEERA